MRCVVTGGAGFIGSHLADALMARGDTVRIVDDFSTGRRENLQAIRPAFELLEGDCADPSVAERAVAGAEVVFHQAAIPSVPRSWADPVATERANVGATVALLEACRKAGVRRLVMAASSAAYGETPTLPKVESMEPSPQSPYAVQKLASEHYCRLYATQCGVETVALRYFNVFGPRQDPRSDDAAGIVYFPRLISYFHDAYVSVLAARGLPLHELIKTSPWIAPIRRAEADFLRPVRFGDRICAALVRAQASTSSIALGWRLTSGGSGLEGAPGEVVHATGKTVHTFVDRSFQRAALPEEMRRAFADALAATP